MDHLDERWVDRLAAANVGAEADELQAWKHFATCSECADRVKRANAEMLGQTLMRLPQGEGVEHGPEAIIGAAPVAGRGRSSEGTGEDIPRRGDVVGRYIIISSVGMGGMGIVYAAYDPELDRKVALKLLRPNAGASDSHARLAREAQAMARISHPNVMAVHDVGTYGHQIFIAMDLVEGGRTISDWLVQDKPSWQEVLRVMRAAGLGLAAAHAAGLVHRDFKPENVLLGRDGRVLVTDFGLARLVEAESDHLGSQTDPPLDAATSRLSSAITRTDALVGTPLYMAPEQYLRQTPDARSDQFSFCTTLYYALYRQHPFELEKMVEAVLGRRPVVQTTPLIVAPPKRTRVPGWIKRILLRGLSFQPEDRFGSMDELLDCLSHPPAATRLSRVFVLALLLVGTAVGAYQGISGQRAALCSRAAEPIIGVWDATVAHQLEAAFLSSGNPEAGAIVRSVSSMLETYARDWVRMRREACEATRLRGEQTEAALKLRMTCLDRRLEEMRELTKLLVRPEVGLINHALEAAGGLSPVSDCADVVALSTPVAAPDDPISQTRLTQLHLQLARVKALEGAGKFDAAKEEAEKAVGEATLLAYPPVLAEALAQEGECLMRLGRGQEAEQVLRRAWRAAEEGRHELVRVQVAAYLAFTMARQKRAAEGLLWGELGQGALRRLGQSPQLEVLLRMNVGSVLQTSSQYAQARKEYLDALALGEKALSADFYFRPTILNNLALTYYGEKQYARAGELLEESISVGERLWGTQHPDIAIWRCNAALLYLRTADYERAHHHAVQCVSVLSGSGFEADSIELGFADGVLGNVLAHQGRPIEALKPLRHSLDVIEKHRQEYQNFGAETLQGMGVAYIEMGRAAEALPFLEKALIKDAPDDVDPETCYQLARALTLTGSARRRSRALGNEAIERFKAHGLPLQVEKVEQWIRRNLR